jgi:hypothetical protein
MTQFQIDASEIVHEIDDISSYENSALQTMVSEGNELSSHEEMSNMINGGSNLVDGVQDEGDAAIEEGDAGTDIVELIPFIGAPVQGAIRSILDAGKGFWDANGGVIKMAIGGYQIGKALGQMHKEPDYGTHDVLHKLDAVHREDLALHSDLTASTYLHSKMLASLALMHHSAAVDDVKGYQEGPHLVIAALGPSIDDVMRRYGLRRDEAFVRMSKCQFTEGLEYRMVFPRRGLTSDVLTFIVHFSGLSAWVQGIDGIALTSTTATGVAYGASAQSKRKLLLTRMPVTKSQPYVYAALAYAARYLFMDLDDVWGDSVSWQNVAAFILTQIQGSNHVPITNHFSKAVSRVGSVETLKEYFKRLQDFDDSPTGGYGHRIYDLNDTEVNSVFGAPANTFGTTTHLIDSVNFQYNTSYVPATRVAGTANNLYTIAVTDHDNSSTRANYASVFS